MNYSCGCDERLCILYPYGGMNFTPLVMLYCHKYIVYGLLSSCINELQY